MTFHVEEYILESDFTLESFIRVLILHKFLHWSYLTVVHLNIHLIKIVERLAENQTARVEQNRFLKKDRKQGISVNILHWKKESHQDIH